MGPEFDRLCERLGVDEGRLINFHVMWGAEAHKMTTEERCATINKAMDYANKRSTPLWGTIFNAIPMDIPGGSEDKILIFSQRALIADRVYDAITENVP